MTNPPKGALERLAAYLIDYDGTTLPDNTTPMDGLHCGLIRDVLSILSEAEKALEHLVALVEMPHARTCPARICDCDLDDTQSHHLGLARTTLSKLKGK